MTIEQGTNTLKMDFAQKLERIPYSSAKDTPDNIKTAFEQAIQKGSIPILVNEDIADPKLKNQGNFNGEIEIPYSSPLLAIKAYETVLAAGFIPKLVNRAQKKVQSYLKEKLEKDVAKLLADPEKETEKQILISSPPDESGEPNSLIILQRIKVATGDGFVISLDQAAKNSLCKALPGWKEQEMRIDVSSGKSHPWMVIRNLLTLGLEPILIKNKQQLRGLIKKAKHLAPVKIASLDAKRDLQMIKHAIEEFGIGAESSASKGSVLDETAKNLWRIKLMKLTPFQQVKQAKWLASRGIDSRLSLATIPEDKLEISVVSKNPDFAMQIFRNLIQEGFAPCFDKVTFVLLKEMCLSDQTITLEVKRGPLLFEQIKQCMKYSLIPSLTEKGKEVLRDFAQGTDLSLFAFAYSPSLLCKNLTLAQNLGIFALPTQEAIEVYAAAKKTEKIMPAVAILPFKKTKTVFLWKKTEFDIEKTLALMNRLWEVGLRISLMPEMEKLVQEAQKRQHEKKILGLWGDTANAMQARAFLKIYQDLKNKTGDLP